MEKRFAYHFDKRSRRITAAIITIIILIFAAFILFGTGSYLPAWFFTLAIAVLALYILSIPRFVELNDQSLDIHCILELTRIHIGDINLVRKVDRKEFKYLFPLLGSYGFFGYYGYYLNFSKWEIIKIYATEWDHLVEIEDIYEQKYLISCREADQLIADVVEANRRYLEEHQSGNLSL